MIREQQQRTKIKICGLKRPEDITEEQQTCYRCIGERTYCKT